MDKCEHPDPELWDTAGPLIKNADGTLTGIYNCRICAKMFKADFKNLAAEALSQN